MVGGKISPSSKPFGSQEDVRHEPRWSLTVTLNIPYLEGSFGAGNSMMSF